MLFIRAWHIIAMVAWFAGLFYLPRLFVYHTEALDPRHYDGVGDARFKVMERRLYYCIIWPAGIATTVFGLWLLHYSWGYYLTAGWMHAKLLLVLLLWVYHGLCGYYLRQFARNLNTHSMRFYRIFNEIPTLLLIVIVILVTLKPLMRF